MIVFLTLKLSPPWGKINFENEPNCSNPRALKKAKGGAAVQVELALYDFDLRFYGGTQKYFTE